MHLRCGTEYKSAGRRSDYRLTDGDAGGAGDALEARGAGGARAAAADGDNRAGGLRMGNNAGQLCRAGH